MAERIYKTALGIQTGDIVRTSYKTGPYEVWWITDPYFSGVEAVGTIIIRTWPVISLTLVEHGKGPGPGGSGYSWINDIRQEGDRWFTDSNDEIFVEKRSVSLPVDMFRSYPQIPDPYTFNPDVDYQLAGEIFNCEQCGDFNAKRYGLSHHAYCPKCGRWSAFRLILMEPRDHTKKQLNAVVSLNS